MAQNITSRHTDLTNVRFLSTSKNVKHKGLQLFANIEQKLFQYALNFIACKGLDISSWWRRQVLILQKRLNQYL